MVQIRESRARWETDIMLPSWLPLRCALSPCKCASRHAQGFGAKEISRQYFLKKELHFFFHSTLPTFSLSSSSSLLQFSVQGCYEMHPIWTSPTGAAARRACLSKLPGTLQGTRGMDAKDPTPWDPEDPPLILTWVPGKASWRRWAPCWILQVVP